MAESGDITDTESDEEYYEKGTYLAIRNERTYDIGRLEEDYGQQNKNQMINIMWLRKMDRNNPLVYEEDSQQSAIISKAILEKIEEGQILLGKFHISQTIHDRLIQKCREMPLQGYAGSSP
ncbi:UNVERIFIED_CONTAM: hypothetical protein RMT77_012836 [Armadillidium vulgare]